MNDENLFQITNILKNFIQLDDIITKGSLSLILEFIEKYTKLTKFGTDNAILNNIIEIIGHFIHSLHKRPTLLDN